MYIRSSYISTRPWYGWREKCYGNGKYSVVNAKSGWTDLSNNLNDKFQYVCVPAGKTFIGYDNDSGNKSGWYGWTRIVGPYSGSLGCGGELGQGATCVATRGSKGTLGSAGKITSWEIT